MSEESAPSPEPEKKSSAERVPRVRRISNPRPKKTVRPAPASEVAEKFGDLTEDQPVQAVPAKPKFPEFPESSESDDAAGSSASIELIEETGAQGGDWPEPDAPSAGAASGSENPKRKRRRKKGKGNGAQTPPGQVEADSAVTMGSSAEGTPQPAPQQSQSPHQPLRPNQGPRLRVDPELMAKFAWKIYLSEVSEEGVALVGDNDAKDLARRCFRLAEIFIEEQSRRR